MKSERFVGACRRGYRSVFFWIFCHGKVYPGEGSWIDWKGVKKLFIDRLGGDGGVVQDANRRGLVV